MHPNQPFHYKPELTRTTIHVLFAVGSRRQSEVFENALFWTEDGWAWIDTPESVYAFPERSVDSVTIQRVTS